MIPPAASKNNPSAYFVSDSNVEVAFDVRPVKEQLHNFLVSS